MPFQIFQRRFRTLRGDRVYSEGEKMIADFLYKSKIKYEYENPIRLERKKFNPDFFLPDHSIYIEYFGMIGDPEYAKDAQLKKIAYYENKLDVISIIPQHLGYLETIINQRIADKKGIVNHSDYLKLTKQYVPHPVSKEWIQFRKEKKERQKNSMKFYKPHRYLNKTPDGHFVTTLKRALLVLKGTKF
jgi:hypothetical protein